MTRPLRRASFDQDAAHGLGGRGEEVPATVPLLRFLAADQTQVRLMDQRGGLKRLAGCLGGHPSGGEFPQFVVNEWEEVGGRFWVSTRGRVEQAGHIGHWVEFTG